MERPHKWWMILGTECDAKSKLNVVVLQVNQELKITNEDQTLHNVHAQATSNREWNLSQTQGAAPIIQKFDKPEFISVK